MYNDFNYNIMSNFKLCWVLDEECKKTTSWETGLSNLEAVLRKFFSGVAAGLVQSFDIIKIVQDLIKTIWEIGSIIQNLWNLITNPGLIVKGFIEMLDNFANQSYLDKSEKWSLGLLD